MRKLNFILLILAFSSMYAQQFTEIADLQGVIYGDVLWVDSQNNGVDKLVVSGYDIDYNNFSAIYSYENGEFTQTNIPIEPFGYATMDKLDVNQDGFIDFIITGLNSNGEEVIHLYINDGLGGFTEQILPFSGVTTGKIRAADLNGDGYDDFVITGISRDGYIAELYLNDGDGGFYLHNTPFFGNSFGNIEIFDANNDGNLDVLITGFNNSGNPDTQLYLNDGEGNFISHSSGLPPVYFSATTAGDYDNDGNIDILITGFDRSYNEYSALYKNDGSANFNIDSNVDLQQLYWGSASFVDYNSDGDIDIFLTGTNSSDEIFSLLYKNNNGEFTQDTISGEAISGVYISNIEWADLDSEKNSGLVVSGMTKNMEAITKIYKKDTNAITYCEIDESNLEAVEAINLVNFAGIDNESPMNTSLVYEDFTDITGNVIAGESYTITIEGDLGVMGSSMIWVYIDWNQNGILDDDDESYYVGVMADWNTGSSISAEINVPESALSGNTRMRVIKDSQINNSPCQSPTWGQVEDYTINVEVPSDNCFNELPGLDHGDIGCVSFDYKGNSVEYTTVRGADGKIWLQQNLGSDRIANSATDEDAYGDLFQWGRWDDGHQNRDSENSNILPNPNNPAGLNGGSPYFYVTSPEWWKNGASSDTWEAETPDNVTSTNGCDPCKALGENWRLPTSDEWSEVIDAENISDIASAFDSNLKLTIAGARGDNGIYNDGQKGYYWSKTTSDNPNFAKYLYYSDYIVNPTAGGFREQGSSIRCIYAIADEIVCEQPTNISEDQITDSTIEISWDASPNETSGYNWLLVDCGDSPSTANAIQQGSVPTGITNLIIQDLTPETSYDLYIQTNCDINESDWKGPIKFTTESAICDSPTDLMVDTIIDNSVVFSWVLGLNETQWEFIYGESGFDVNSEGVSQIVNEPYATIQNIPEEIEYDAYVRSICNDNQMSDWTGPISFSIENLAVADHEFNDFIFFPNPMDDELYLKANKPMEQIQIFNLLGQEVIILKTNATENILDVKGIQSGSYLMKVTMNGISKTYRIFKK